LLTGEGTRASRRWPRAAGTCCPSPPPPPRRPQREGRTRRRARGGDASAGKPRQSRGALGGGHREGDLARRATGLGLGAVVAARTNSKRTPVDSIKCQTRRGGFAQSCGASSLNQVCKSEPFSFSFTHMNRCLSVPFITQDQIVIMRPGTDRWPRGD
jgi:hypothetical protein